MGSPLSPVIANLYMEHFEQTALQSSQFKPSTFLRFVDDTFAVWPHGKDKLNSFLDHLNSIHSKIQFTMEIENDRQLPFLDVLVTRNSDGTLGHSVYRKPTHTDRYLYASSHHHPIQKTAVLNTLANRALAISDTKNVHKEKQYLIKTLQLNGYSKTSIVRAIQRQEKSKSVNSLTTEPTVQQNKAFLPYIQGTTDKIGRILQKYNIKTIFRPFSKIRDRVRPLKDKIPLNSSGVYHINCSCGKCYVGETGRLVITRLKEHIRLTKNMDTTISAIATHSTETNHAIDFENTKILYTCNNYYERKIMEAIEIRKHRNNFNRDAGFELSPTWLPLIRKLNSTCSQEAAERTGRRRTQQAGENVPDWPERPDSTPSPPRQSESLLESNVLPAAPPLYNLRRRRFSQLSSNRPEDGLL